MSQAIHERLRGDRSSTVSNDLLRMRLLEELLHGARSSVTKVANDLSLT